ncbi:YncE family protein [Actinoplanes sp. NPDC020271]|uniref:YncE family protein n=1 Tax=Actinoplanes sp. NPDC020271 TaxID=3363896 RepID=UPI0037A11899
MRSIPAAVSVAVLTGATAVALQLSTGPAAADSAVRLPNTSLGDLVVDGPHQRIFISDPAGGRVLTIDYAGDILATTDGLPGVGDLMLTDRLYAAMPDAGKIVAIDPATSARTATYDTGGAPQTLAAAGGKIWFGEGREGLGSLDLSGPAPVVVHRPDAPAGSSGQWWDFAPKIVTSPADPDLIATMEGGSPTSTVALLDVSTDPPTEVAHRAISGPGGGGGGRDLAFSSDGSRLIVTAIQSTVIALSSTDLSTVESYQPADAFPGAVAVRDDNTFAVVNGGRHSPQKAIALYQPGTVAAVKELDLQPVRDVNGYVNVSLDLTSPAGVAAWEPGGQRLFGIGYKSSTDAWNRDPVLTLQVLNDPAKTPVTIHLTAPARAEIGQSYTVVGRISDPVPAGLPLVITRFDPATPGGQRVGPQTVPESGRLQFYDAPTVAGTITYTVSIPGDEKFAGATASAALPAGVTQPTTLTLDRDGSTWAYGTTVTFTARLGATSRSREVQIWADPDGSDQPNRLVRAGVVDSRGVFTAGLKLTRNTTVTAVFPGDDFTPAKTMRSAVRTRASVGLTVAKQYKTGKIGSTSYYYFRRTKNPVFTTTINPYPGRRQYFQIDVYTRGRWKLWGEAYYSLSSAGKSVRELKGTHSTGVRYRVRSAYIANRTSDTANVTTFGPYRYFTFTK